MSPYMVYISKVRQKLQLLCAPPSVAFLKLHLNAWFLDHTNLALSQLSLPCVQPLSSFSRSRYVCEHDGCSTLASFMLSNAGLGNRAPRPGRLRAVICYLCHGILDEAHVAFICPRMDDFRYDHTDLMVFMSMCRARGILQFLAYKMYVRGLDWDGDMVPTSVYLARGKTLKRVVDEWLRRT